MQHSFLANNVRNLIRDLGRERPAAIPRRLATIAGRKAARLSEELMFRTGLDSVLGRAYRGKGVALMFHEIHSDVDAELRTGCDQAQLGRVIRAVRKAGRDVVTMDEGLRRLGDPASRPFALLTFDDAYRDNLTNALPVLEELDAPMTLFVPTGMITREVNAWWLGMRQWLIESESVDVTPMGRRFDCADLASKLSAKRQVTSWIGEDQSRADSLSPLFAAHGIDIPALVDRYAMTAGELRRMAEHPLVTVGAHTATHRFLSSLDDVTVSEEFTTNKLFLEELLARPVQTLAYPYGTRGACGRRESQAAALAGFRASFTTRPGHLFGAHLEDPHLMPRIDVGYAPQSAAALASRLTGLQRAMVTNFGNPVALLD